MNAIQQKVFGLLSCFVRVCEELHIPYYLVCGTALGAVKYSGFIPWDDDVDVGLLRPDYERFLRLAPPLLPEGVFLQNHRTDPAYPHPYTKLRDSRTTLIEENKAHLPINHGVYIDVFPLDGYPERKLDQRILEIRKRVLSWKWGCALNVRRRAIARIHYTVFRALGCHRRTARILEKFDRVISAYPVETARVWCNHGNRQKKLEYAPREQYGSGTKAFFEGMEVTVPERFDEYLTQKYGDWRSDPPAAAQKSHHGVLVADADRPYTEYLDRNEAF